MNWAVEKCVILSHADSGGSSNMLTLFVFVRNEYLNSKPGRLAHGGEE